MRVNLRSIPPDGLELEEAFPASKLDLDVEVAKFNSPVRVNAFVTRITNSVNVELEIDTDIDFVCSRCLEGFRRNLRKKARLNYPVSAQDNFLDLDQDIREEIILEYPVNPLCRKECKGLCLKCGKNLNQQDCGCSN